MKAPGFDIEHFTRLKSPFVHVSQASPPRNFIEELRASGYSIIVMDGASIHSKDALMQAFASAMHFPEYFGSNWDAVDECIRDLSWKPAPGYLLIYGDAHILWECCPQDFAILADVSQSTGVEWSQDGVPFHVLLIGPDSLQHEVSKLLGQGSVCRH